MSAMEKSLRRALEAGDARDTEFRDSIYLASERALERLLLEKPTDEETAHSRRVHLAETINAIEAEYFEAFGLEEAQQPGSEDFTREDGGADDAEPLFAETVPINGEDEERFVAESEASLSYEEDAVPSFWADRTNDSVDDEGDRDEGGDGEGTSSQPVPYAAAGVDWSPKAGSKWRPVPRTPRRLGMWAPVILVALCAVLAGIFFVYGAIVDPLEKRGDAAAAATTEDAAWINLFDGKQLNVIATPSGGTVESVTIRGVSAVRLAPAAPGGEINIAIGPGVVDEIEGQTVRVEIVAGSSDGKTREFGVRCLFGDQTVCARQRFHTAQASESFVFDMAVPTKSSDAGVLAIDPTLGSASSDIDLYSVRLRGLGAS